MRKSFSPKILGSLLLGLSFAAIMTYYVFQDINLELDLLQASASRLQEVVLENLEFEREYGGDLWSARISQAAKDGDVLSIRSVDAYRRTDGGDEWLFKGDHGVYHLTDETLELFDVRGVIEDSGRTLRLNSAQLTWKRQENKFIFSEGLEVESGEFSLTALSAVLEAEGVILLREGGTVKWLPRAD
jgi:hypothetical protein